MLEEITLMDIGFMIAGLWIIYMTCMFFEDERKNK